MLKPNEIAALWRRTALTTLGTAKQLRNSQDHRSCVSRAYYAAYQAATSICIAHDDAVNFPPNRNNPTHEQLPDLIANNGDLPLNKRRSARRLLRELRTRREDADYKVGRTVGAQEAKAALLRAITLFERLEIDDDND